MQRRVNPREARRMMQRMGMSMDNVNDVQQVIIRTPTKDIVIAVKTFAPLMRRWASMFWCTAIATKT